MVTKNKAIPTALPIFSLLGLLFVGLKLTGHITWSWFWVTLPFWWGFAMIFLIVIGALLLATLMHEIETRKHRRVQRKLQQRKESGR